MTQGDLIKKLQAAMNAQGERLSVDGVIGPLTKAALAKFDVQVVVSKPVLNDAPRGTPIEWARGEIGQKEVPGVRDNPRIRWYHTHCANIGSKEHPDEVAWCSSFINAAADETGMQKTDNALASSWMQYGVDTGDEVPEGAVVVIRRSDGGYHVTLANRRFNRRGDSYFEGLGGNQSNAVTTSTYRTDSIVASRLFVKRA